MINKLNQVDTVLFYWINQHYCPLLDWVLWFFSQSWSWFFFLLYPTLFCIKKVGWKNSWIVLVGIVLCFLLSDRISVMCFKDVVQRLRPCHALDNVRMFHTSCGGKYGFISSHAANCFSITLFLSLMCSNLNKWYKSIEQSAANNSTRWITLLLVLWALVVGYSRPYLGKHYPGDVICGAIVGCGIGALVAFIVIKIHKRVIRKQSVE